MNIRDAHKQMMNVLDDTGSRSLTVTEMKQERASLFDQNGEMFNLAESQKRDLTPEEIRTIEMNQKEIDKLSARIKVKTQRLIEEAEEDDPEGKIIKEFGGISSPRRRPKKGVEIWRSMADNSKGSEIPVLSANARLKDHVPSDEYQGSVEQYLVDRAKGFSRAMDTTADSSMVPVGISSQIIDEARALSSVFRAGARVFPMTTKTETIARITESATPEWKAENASHSASNITTEPLTFTAKTLIASVKSSVELAEDAGNLAQVVRHNLTQQLALELDRVALLGSGQGSEPAGVLNQSNVQSLDLGANGEALTSYAPFSQAYEKILSVNGYPNATIFSPRTWGTIDRLVDGQDQPLNPPMSFQSLLKLPTSQVPNDLAHGDAENASVAFVGDFSQLIVGVRTNLQLEVTRVGSDSDASAWEDLQIWWRAYLRADIQLLHSDHFCVIEGIIPSSQ